MEEQSSLMADTLVAMVAVALEAASQLQLPNSPESCLSPRGTVN